MPNTGNIFFDVSTDVGEEIFQAKKAASKVKSVEFGMRKGTAADWRKAVQDDPKFRKQQLDTMGTKEFLKRWRGNTNG